MGGTPVRLKLKADVCAAYATDEDPDGWEHVIDLIASGVTVSALSKKFGVSRSFFSTVLHSDRVGISDRVKKAHKDAAEALLDMAQADVDDLADTATRDQVTLSRVRADTKIKLAALKDPERYQTKPDAPHVHISIGSLHFEALRAANRNSLPSGTHAALPAHPSLPPAPVDAEIISIEEPAHGNEDHAPAVTG